MKADGVPHQSHMLLPQHSLPTLSVLKKSDNAMTDLNLEFPENHAESERSSKGEEKTHLTSCDRI